MAKQSDEQERLRAALEWVGEMIQQLPCGCDEEADPNDTSPADATAHLGGLILQHVRGALRG